MRNKQNKNRTLFSCFHSFLIVSKKFQFKLCFFFWLRTRIFNNSIPNRIIFLIWEKTFSKRKTTSQKRRKALKIYFYKSKIPSSIETSDETLRRPIIMNQTLLLFFIRVLQNWPKSVYSRYRIIWRQWCLFKSNINLNSAFFSNIASLVSILNIVGNPPWLPFPRGQKHYLILERI